MNTATQNLNGWSTDELIGEVVRRAAADGPLLRSVEGIIIRARLAEQDQRSVASTIVAPLPAIGEGVRGTIEMVLASAGVVAEPAVRDSHEVDAAVSGAHSHDHTHRTKASAKFAAHDHHHLHPEDIKADALLNGHSHPRPHARLPWERSDETLEPIA